MTKKLDLVGLRFGRLLVIEDAGRNKFGAALWRCKCDCGRVIVVRGASLRCGETKSCGCLHDEKAAERASKLNKTHGLMSQHKRLYSSVLNHFIFIRKQRRSYHNWIIDRRYSGDEGVAKFCETLIKLQPENCDLYEKDKSLDLDKDNDNGNHIFCPESVTFIDNKVNRSKQCNNISLKDGTRLVDLCRTVGITTGENRYKKFSTYQKRTGNPHPELVQRVNELVCLYRKTYEMLRLKVEVEAFRLSAHSFLQSVKAPEPVRPLSAVQH